MRNYITATVPYDDLQYIENLCLRQCSAARCIGPFINKNEVERIFAQFKKGMITREHHDHNQSHSWSPATDRELSKLAGEGSREGIGLLAKTGEGTCRKVSLLSRIFGRMRRVHKLFSVQPTVKGQGGAA